HTRCGDTTPARRIWSAPHDRGATLTRLPGRPSRSIFPPPPSAGSTSFMHRRLSTATAAFSLAVAATAAGAQTYPVRMELDTRIPMRDGITLSADIYRPE